MVGTLSRGLDILELFTGESSELTVARPLPASSRDCARRARARSPARYGESTGDTVNPAPVAVNVSLPSSGAAGRAA
jgi:hypothetical protein